MTKHTIATLTGIDALPAALRDRLTAALGEDVIASACTLHVRRAQLRRGRTRYWITSGEAALIGHTRIAALEVETPPHWAGDALDAKLFKDGDDPGYEGALERFLEPDRRRALYLRLTAFALAGATITTTSTGDSYQVYPAHTPDEAITVALPLEITAAHIAAAIPEPAH